MKDGQAVTARAVIPAANSPEPAPSQPEPTQVPAPVTVPEPKPEPVVTGEVPGLGGAGELPGPRTIGEAVVSILGPAAIGLLGALLGGMVGGGGGAPTPPPTEAPATPPKTPPKKPRGRGEGLKEKTPVVPPDDPKDTKKKKTKTETDEDVKPSETAEKETTKGGKKTKEGYLAGLWRRTKGALTSAVDAAKDVAEAEKDIKENPSLLIQTGKNAYEDVKQGLESASPLAEKIAEAAPGMARAIFQKTLNLATRQTPELVDLDDLMREAQIRKKIEDIGVGMVQGVWETVKGAATDPDKMADLVKNLTGLEDLEKATEGNRPLGERLIHGILGALGVVGLAESVGKVAVKGLRSGASGLVKTAGREAAGGLSDDAARLAAKAAGKADDAASLAGKAAGTADDAARAATREASEKYIARKAAEIEKKGLMPAEYARKGDYIDAPNVKPDLSGYTDSTVDGLRKISHEEGAVIYARPSSPHAGKLIDERKAIPKQAWVKNKTANAEDILLGAPENSELLAVSFEPKMPPDAKLAEMTDDAVKSLRKRFKERSQEWIDQADHLWENADLCTVKNKIIIDKFSRLPYTCDVDIMGFRHVDGSRLSVKKTLRLIRRTRRTPGVNVAHGSHEDWIKAMIGTSDRVVDDLIDLGVRNKHTLSSGKDALVTFRPGHRKPSASWLADHAAKVGP